MMHEARQHGAFDSGIKALLCARSRVLGWLAMLCRRVVRGKQVKEKPEAIAMRAKQQGVLVVPASLLAGIL